MIFVPHLIGGWRKQEWWGRIFDQLTTCSMIMSSWSRGMKQFTFKSCPSPENDIYCSETDWHLLLLLLRQSFHYLSQSSWKIPELKCGQVSWMFIRVRETQCFLNIKLKKCSDGSDQPDCPWRQEWQRSTQRSPNNASWAEISLLTEFNLSRTRAEVSQIPTSWALITSVETPFTAK